MNFRITSDRFGRVLSMWVSFAGALIVLICAVRFLAEFATDPAQFVIGLLAALAVAISMIILGIVTGPRSGTT